MFKLIIGRLAILLLSVVLLTTCTPEKPKISDPEKLVNKFFDSYKKDGPREAVRLLILTNKYFSTQEVDSVGIKLENFSKNLGDFQGYEKIRERTYGQSISLLTYVVKYSRVPLRLNFKFYDPGNGWRVQNFNFESDFIDELDETIKPYRLKENLDIN